MSFCEAMDARRMNAADTSVSDQKARIRQEALALRDALPPATRAAAAESIAARPFPLRIEPGVIVSGFSPMKSEINPVP
jgi:5-formyltetrahydrofolate cyclo-ligase